MLTHTDIKQGVKIVLDGKPYEILEARALKKAQGRVVIQTKIRNLMSGHVFSRNFHQGETLEEAEISRLSVKFLYSKGERIFFCQEDDPSKRFELNKDLIGPGSRFLKQGQVVEGIVFNNRVINISLPIKVQLRVIEAPPGFKGERREPGTKTVTLETGTKINTPLFIKEGDIVEVNTENGEYVRRIEPNS